MTTWALPQADTYFAPILAADPRGFEIDHLQLALSHCNQFRTAVDGGAHVGTWTCELAKHFEHVIAFEPAEDTFRCLERNTEDSGKVICHRTALGANSEEQAIADDRSRKGNTGARHIAPGKGVTVAPLDAWALDDLDFLKLDVEGYELFALKGAVETLKRCKPVVLIEAKAFYPPRYGVHYLDATKFLEGLGYREAARARNDRVFKYGEQ